ncbi:hypothetical protein ARAM_005729 [Aspergillus rambellii]|uniref:Protein kinase domain-containing protein n=1 Tax=Aspergillus rambellii TaxID=308745 RepID=A0A0F8X4R8_9EURO|nr:hypothetical protein ARAM_005729 [Aspergillus rambellii]
MDHDEGQWTSIFFSERSPEWIKTVQGNQGEFRPFCLDNKKWILWKPVKRDLTTHTSSPDRNQVLQLLTRYHGKYVTKYVAKYVAKVFPEYTNSDAEAQHPTYPLRMPFTAWLLVWTLNKSKFHFGYFNRRAIILEAIQPCLASRRVLAANNVDATELITKFSQRLQNLQLKLSCFEKEWYRSLFTDRLRRLTTLHRIGITHGDVREDHFRIPGDFYDTVLYDFSISYP